ncbi:MAG: phytanoyl-CoA dioxygenase family protein, partial [Pseudomonadota bacterium]
MQGTPVDITHELERDGAAVVRGVFTPAWVELLKRGIESNIAAPSPLFRKLSTDDGGFVSDMWSRRYIPEFAEFCASSPAAQLASQALRSPSVRLAQDVWFLKRPGTSERTPWHHDTVIDGPFCSIWVALDPTPREATLEFVRGSHAWGQAMMPKSFFDTADSGDGTAQFYKEFHDGDGASKHAKFAEIPDIEAARDDFDIIGWALEPGDCVVFDARTIHGAPGNDLSHSIGRFVT